MSAAATSVKPEQARASDWISHETRQFPTRSDKAALVLIGLTLVLLLAGWRGHSPSMVDTWYHLALADQILQRGEVPLWDDWEFAPYGRPNLYPPVLHILLAGVGAVTGGVLNAGTLFDTVQPVRVAGISESVETLGPGRRLTWTVPEGSGNRLAAIEIPAAETNSTGVEIHLRSDRVEPLTLGIRSQSGGEERFVIVLPMENEWRVVCVPRAWMDQVAPPSRGARSEGLYLSWASEEELPSRRVEVHHVHLLYDQG